MDMLMKNIALYQMRRINTSLLAVLFLSGPCFLEQRRRTKHDLWGEILKQT